MKIYTGVVTAAMSAFATEVLRDVRLVVGATEARTIDGVPLLARVEIHTNGTVTTPGPHPHRGVTLYTLDAEDRCPDTERTVVVAARAEGVDVSSYQRGIDWSQMKASGKSFAFIKVHEGLFLDDAAAAEHYAGAGAQEILRGAYTFFRVGVDAREQVKRFVDRAWTIGSAWELPYVLDVESQGKVALGGATPAAFADAVLEALHELAHTTGQKPLVYASSGFLDQLPEHDWQSVANLWVAHWGAKTPRLPRGWTKWDFWQIDAHAHVPGYPREADVNVYRGSEQELRSALV